MLVVGTWTYAGTGWRTTADAALALAAADAARSRRPGHAHRRLSRLESRRELDMSETGMLPPTLAADQLGALLMKPEAAARVLSVSRNKVYELMRSGALPSVKLGGSRRVITSGLVEFVARLAKGPAA